MQVTPVILGAGGSARLAIGGDYFRILILTSVVTVRLYKAGRIISEAANILAGYWSKPTSGFDEVEIVSPGAQTVYIGTLFGTGGYDRAAGDFNITGSTGDATVRNKDTNGNSIDTIAITAAPALATRKMTVQDVGIVYGASFQSNSVLGAAGTAQVFAAASNPNGAIVWLAQGFTASASGNHSISLLAKATAPTTSIDGDLIYCDAPVTAANVSPNHELPRPVFIPAGKGLFWWSAQIETLTIKKVLYSLL